MNQKLTLITIIVSALFLSACTPSQEKAQNLPPSEIESSQAQLPTEEPLPQPTISQSTELTDLEKELNAIQILEEDFSDLWPHPDLNRGCQDENLVS